MGARSTDYKHSNDQVGILMERKAHKALVRFARQQGMLRSRALTTLVQYGVYYLAVQPTSKQTAADAARALSAAIIAGKPDAEVSALAGAATAAGLQSIVK
jgi:hypothetical protein